MNRTRSLILSALVSLGILSTLSVSQGQVVLNNLADSTSYAIGMNFTISEVLPSFDQLKENGHAVNREVVVQAIANRLLNTSSDFEKADSISYRFGTAVAEQTLLPVLINLQALGITVNREAITQGIDDVVSGNATLIPDAAAQRTLVALQEVIVERTGEYVAAYAEKNREEEREFLANSGSLPGVIITPTGLQYKVITEGKGIGPEEDDTVLVRCRGTFPDGTVFDQSTDAKGVECPVSGVIPGWKEALVMMKPGDKWQLYIPSSLAYGEQGGLGGRVGPNQVLIYEIELVKVK